MERKNMKLRPYWTAAYSGDDSNISSDGKGMVVNTITGKMPGKYTLQSWLWNFTPPIPEPPIKSVGLSLTTLPSGHYEIVMSGCHSLVGGVT